MSALGQALLAFQAEGIHLQKNAINPHFRNRYISLDTLIEQVLPLMNKHGLVLVQEPTAIEGAPALTTTVMHAESGERLEATMPLLLPKNDPQGQGSALTYARRYALMATLGLVADEDTDGAQSRPAPQPRQSGAAKRPMKGGATGADKPPATAPDSPWRAALGESVVLAARAHKMPVEKVTAFAEHKAGKRLTELSESEAIALKGTLDRWAENAENEAA